MSLLKGTFSFTFISEFDQFLADRAAAGGQRTGSVKSGASRPRQRQMQMENQADDEMFGLWFTCTNTFFFQTLEHWFWKCLLLTGPAITWTSVAWCFFFLVIDTTGVSTAIAPSQLSLGRSCNTSRNGSTLRHATSRLVTTLEWLDTTAKETYKNCR